MSAPPSDDLRAAVAAQGWFHTIDLGDGIVTDGRDESPRKLGWIGSRATCAGAPCSTSAPGTGSSRSSASAAAERVVALDGPGVAGARVGPGRVRDALGVRPRAGGARAVRRGPRAGAGGHLAETVGRFDVVLFLGVLYHLKHPWAALERVASVCDGLLILETHADLLDLRRPAMALLPRRRGRGRRVELVGPNSPR